MMWNISGDARSIGIIGGADGPTAVFLAGQTETAWSWINVFGIIIVVLILLPNLVYAWKQHKASEKSVNQCTNRVMNLLEQVGRYGCMFFMIVNVFGEYGFRSVPAFLAYLFGNAILLLGYWIVWILYFVKQTRWKSMVLAVLPTAIFLLCGVTLAYLPLIAFSLLFGIGHIYVTAQNVKGNI